MSVNSFADELRARSDEAIAQLFAVRPDLLSPVPTDLSALSARANSTPSLMRALESLNKFQLEVLTSASTLTQPFSKSELQKIVAEKLELVGLPGIEKKKPSELSGGMKKRVGLARALVTNPKYILYDEPTTGLDPIMSDSIDELIIHLNNEVNVTSIVVTHDMFSVKNVADKVAMMHNGKIYFSGTYDEVLKSTDRVIKNFVQRTVI